MSTQIVEKPADTLGGSPGQNPRFRLERYGARNYAVYDQDTLVVVALYKCGASEVLRRLIEAHAKVQATS